MGEDLAVGDVQHLAGIRLVQQARQIGIRNVARRGGILQASRDVVADAGLREYVAGIGVQLAEEIWVDRRQCPKRLDIAGARGLEMHQSASLPPVARRKG